MGLDQYLNKKVEKEVGYWRKANQVHKWFVDNVQGGKDDCGSYKVEKSQLETLLEICKNIKQKCPLVAGMVANGQEFKNGKWEDCMEAGMVMKNWEYAHKVLPRQEGFFFGGTGYDQWYMKDIDSTIEIIGNVLKDWGDWDEDYSYSSSW